MSHDAGNLTQGLNGKTIIWILIAALIAIGAPYLKNLKGHLPTSSIEAGKPLEIYVGLRNKDDFIQISISHEWSSIIYVRAGNEFEVIPPEDSYLEYQVDNGREIVKFRYGETPDLPGFIFRLRGVGGMATVRTSPTSQMAHY